VGEITVHGWDAKAKREIVGRAKPEGEIGEGARKHAAGTSLALAGHEPSPADVASAEAMAKGRLRRIAERFVVAQAEVTGDPRIVPGTVVRFEKLGQQIDGKYRVDHAAHEFSKHGYLVRLRAVRIAKLKPPAQQVEKEEKALPERQPPPEDVHVIAGRNRPCT
jgi:phage protein D